jgi:hypothetical protein
MKRRGDDLRGHRSPRRRNFIDVNDQRRPFLPHVRNFNSMSWRWPFAGECGDDHPRREVN